MATITSTAGVLDVQGIVDQLMTIEQQPLTKLATANTALQTQISAFGKIQSGLASLRDAARALTETKTWQASSAKSSNEEIVKVTSGGEAAKGAFSVQVDQLAQSQSAVSGHFASSTAVVGGGKLVIQFGSSAGGSFAADSERAALNITIPAGATLADVRTRINNANAGISASLVNDGGQTRLMLRSTATGEKNGFSIDVQGAENGGAGGLGGLAFTPGGGGSMSLLQEARDARYSIDGLALTSASNSISNALDGVSLELRKVSTDAVPIEVGTDAEALKTSINAFVTAYNAVNTSLASLTKYDEASKTAGALQGNFLVVQLHSKIRSVVGSVFTPPATTDGGSSTSSLTRLSDIGIEVQRDGSLKLNETKFANAATNPAALRTFFGSNDINDPNGKGIGLRFTELIGQVIGNAGSISGALESLRSRSSANAQRQVDLESRLETTRARLVRQYSQLDQNLTSMSSLSTSLAGQLATLSSNWNS